MGTHCNRLSQKPILWVLNVIASHQHPSCGYSLKLPLTKTYLVGTHCNCLIYFDSHGYIYQNFAYCSFDLRVKSRHFKNIGFLKNKLFCCLNKLKCDYRVHFYRISDPQAPSSVRTLICSET